MIKVEWDRAPKIATYYLPKSDYMQESWVYYEGDTAWLMSVNGVAWHSTDKERAVKFESQLITKP